MKKAPNAWTDAKGKLHADIESCRVADVADILFPGVNVADDVKSSVFNLATTIVEKKAEIVDVLTMTENSRPGARAINGGKKTRKKKEPTPAAPSQPSLPSVVDSIPK